MEAIENRAKWIWRYRGLKVPEFSFTFPLIEAEKNRFVYFRKTFELPNEVLESSVLVSADGRYRLFVNGVLVGRGPTRCSPDYQTVNEYDIKHLLKKGRNVIAALVHAYGRNTSWYELPKWEQARAFGCGGFFLQGEAKCINSTIQLDSDKSWKFKESDAWQREVPSTSLGFREIFDAGNEPPEWNQLNASEKDWENAEELSVKGRHFNGSIVPFPRLFKSELPNLVESDYFFQTIDLAGEVKPVHKIEEIAANLQDEAIKTFKNCTLDDAINLLNPSGTETTKVCCANGYDVSIVFDLGEIVNGRVFFELEANAGCLIDLTFGEKQRADGRVTMQKGIPGEFEVPHAHRYKTKNGNQYWEQFEWYGFRYIQITIRSGNNGLLIRRIGVKKIDYTDKQPGAFSCSDNLLNEVWQTGVRTVALCMNDGYNDCPTREQRQWVGDTYVSAKVNQIAFGDTQLTKRMLRQVAQSQQSSGLVMMSAPGDFAITPFTNIPEFSLYWILIADFYYEQTADIALIDDLYPSMVKVIDWFLQWLNNDDLLNEVKHWMFVDWAEIDKDGEVTVLNALFVKSLRIMQQFSMLLKMGDKASKYESLTNKITSAINTHLWDQNRGVYIDARKDGVQSRRVSQQSNATAVAFDVAPAERYNSIFNYISDQKRILLTGSGLGSVERVDFDEDYNVTKAQPFYTHILHQAYRKMGKQSAILQHIRTDWGNWIKHGLRTWPETWQLETITSTCHGWSSTPSIDLSTDILGVQQLKPGFEEILIAPECFDLTRAKGIYPTLKGLIKVEWKKGANKFELLLNLPEGVKAFVKLPEINGGIQFSITLNDKVVSDNEMVLTHGEFRIIQNF